MRVSFHDVHERERTRQHFDHRSKGSGKSRRNYAHMAEDEDPIEDYDMPEYDNIDENAEVFADEALSRMTWSSTEVRWKLIHRTMEPPTMMKSMKLTLQWKSNGLTKTPDASFVRLRNPEKTLGMWPPRPLGRRCRLQQGIPWRTSSWRKIQRQRLWQVEVASLCSRR